MKFVLKIGLLVFIVLANAAVVFSDENKITAYFFNDSVNGFQFSDAYETHNMGLKFEKDNTFYQIDLGIVTPDMFEFENRFRTANRSFGEFITLGYGKNKFFSNEALQLDFFTKITSQGNFGISGLQSILHQFANFQDDIDLLETVRMPSQTWIGVGTDLKFLKEDSNQNHHFGILSYLGSDRLSSQPYISLESTSGSWSQFGKLGVDFVLYDNIISSPPVQSKVREVRPVISFGFIKKIGPIEISISENLSLPSISTDNRLYARLFMSASVSLEKFSELFSLKK